MGKIQEREGKVLSMEGESKGSILTVSLSFSLFQLDAPKSSDVLEANIKCLPLSHEGPAIGTQGIHSSITIGDCEFF